MNKIFRTTYISILGAAVAGAGFLACSSASSTANDGGTTGDSGTGGDGNPAGDGAAGDGGGTGDGGTVTRNIGSIHLDQFDFTGSFSTSASASFLRTVPSTVTPPPCPGMVNVKMGACIAAVYCNSASDAGTTDAGMLTIPDTLNAGTITIGGGSADAGAALALDYGPIVTGPYMYKGYKRIRQASQFYVGGDMLTVASAGGADLPAIPTQMLVAPTDVTLTAPACTAGGCPPVDRTADLTVTWTGGAAGKVFFGYETLSSAFAVIVSCDFDAAAGTGTLPAALLAHLEKAGDPGISGVYAYGVKNETPVFMVSDIPTKFEVQGSGSSGGFTVSQ